MQMQHSNTFNASDVTVLGTTRSAKMRLASVKKAFPIYKKQYWVAREMSGVLEFYKNDQDPQAKGTVRAAQIKGVSFSGDKQNKFFDLSVQLRGGIERRFRLNSREERNRWYGVISSMANRHSTQSQWNGVVSAIQRRLASASNLSPYRFVVDLENIGGAPSEMLQYCIEAVDRGVEFTHSIAKTLAGTAAGLKESAAVAAPTTATAAPPAVIVVPAGADEEVSHPPITTTEGLTLQQPSTNSAASSSGPADGNMLEMPASPGPGGASSSAMPQAFASMLPFESVKIVLLNGNLSSGDLTRSPPLYASLSSLPPALSGSVDTTINNGTNNDASQGSMQQAILMPTDAELQRAANAATRYDPLSKQLNLAIILLLDPATGDVVIKHMPLHKVVSMLQSNVWRNPVIEGWLSQNVETQRFLECLNDLLEGGGVEESADDPRRDDRRSSDDAEEEEPELKSNPASDTESLGERKRRRKCQQRRKEKSPSSRSSHFAVTMQWGHDMDTIDEERLEEYLLQHVGYGLLEEVMAAVKELFIEFSASPTSGNSSANPKLLSISSFRKKNSAAHQFLDPKQSSWNYDAHAAGCEDLEQYLPSAQECLQLYVVGVAVCLDRAELESNIPPQLELLHRMWGDRELNTATIVMAKLHRQRSKAENFLSGGRNPLSASSSRNGPQNGDAATISPTRREDTTIFHSVGEQLRELVLTVRLSHAFRLAEQHLSSVYNVRDGCRIDWESFVGAANAAGAEVTAEQLPVFALSFAQEYAIRADRLIRSLKASRVAPMVSQSAAKGGAAGQPLAVAQTFLEATFLPCVCTILIEFASRESQLMVTPSSPPSIRSGIFSDVVVLWNSLTFASAGDFSLEAAMDVSDGVVPTRIHPHSPLVFTYQIPQLSPWVKGYFSNPGNLILAPDRHAPLDGDEDDSSDEEEEFVPDQGDAIASERKVETQVLNIAQVVTLIYDAQHTVPVALKIGTTAIREAIDALQNCFQEGPISKHILVQIYTMNLQRLRELYIKASRDDVTSTNSSHHRRGSMHPSGSGSFYGPISRSAAERMLKDFCEYHTTETRIAEQLTKLESRVMHSRSMVSESRAASPSSTGNVPPPTTTPRWAGNVISHQLSDTLIAGSDDSNGDIHHPSVAASTYPPTNSILGRSSTASPTGMTLPRFDFQAVATVALCSLLPYEAEMAISCRRDILWMGLEDTGKTLLMNSIRGVAQPTHPTIGLTECVIAFKEWVFGCKELGGRADFRTNWKQYMDRVDTVHAVVFVVDAGKPSSFAEAAEYLNGVSGAKLFAGLPFLIIFNNYRVGDKKGPTPQALYDALKLRRVKSKHAMEYVTCDVTVVHSKLKVLSEDVREGLNWLCQVFSASSTSPPPAPPKIQ
jgi:hypothetical protein